MQIGQRAKKRLCFWRDLLWPTARLYKYKSPNPLIIPHSLKTELFLDETSHFIWGIASNSVSEALKWVNLFLRELKSKNWSTTWSLGHQEKRRRLLVRFGIFVLVLVDELNAARINFISNVIRNDFVRCVVCGSVVFYCIAKRRFCILWVCKENG